MKTFELKVHLDVLMRETGQGGKRILFLTEEGDVLTIDKVEYDEENDTVYLHGAIDE